MKIKFPILDDLFGTLKMSEKAKKTLADTDSTLQMVRTFIIAVSILIIILLILYIGKHGLKKIFRKK